MFGANLATNSTLTGSDQELPNPAASIVRVTNAGLSSINMIEAPSFASTGYFLILSNVTGNIITIKNEAGATTSKRILTGTGSDLSVSANASLFLVYDYTSTRWRVIGGTGGGASTRTVSTKTGNYTILATDSIIYIDASSANVVITLPAPASNTGKTFTVKRIDSSTAFVGSIKQNGSETIDGLSEIYLNRQYEFYNLFCDGTNWGLL